MVTGRVVLGVDSLHKMAIASIPLTSAENGDPYCTRLSTKEVNVFSAAAKCVECVSGKLVRAPMSMYLP